MHKSEVVFELRKCTFLCVIEVSCEADLYKGLDILAARYGEDYRVVASYPTSEGTLCYLVTAKEPGHKHLKVRDVFWIIGNASVFDFYA